MIEHAAQIGIDYIAFLQQPHWLNTQKMGRTVEEYGARIAPITSCSAPTFETKGLRHSRSTGGSSSATR
jgi:hypothetical protein